MLGWLPAIEQQVTQLRHDRAIFKKVVEIVGANPQIKDEPSEFFAWMWRMHATSMLMALRRLADDHTKSMSLLRLLKRVKDHPHIISLHHYKSLMRGSDLPATYADRTYVSLLSQDLAAEPAPFEPRVHFADPLGQVPEAPERSLIEKHEQHLLAVTDVLQEFVDKRVAHLDKLEPSKAPTFKEIDEAIDAVTRILQWYLVLLRGVSTSFDSTIQYDWTSVFRVAWSTDPTWAFDEDRWAVLQEEIVESGQTAPVRLRLSRDEGIRARMYLTIIALADDPSAGATGNWNSPYLRNLAQEKARELRRRLGRE